MRIPRIYTEQQLAEGLSVELEPGPSQHLARSLRMQAGDKVVLFNGSGGEHQATIADVGKRGVSVTIGACDDVDLESRLAIHLGIAASRGERMDWVIQKATELGVSEITPLFTQRTEIKLSGERAAKKHRHWQQIAISACEQSGRNSLPRLNPIGDLDSWLKTTEAQRKFVLHHRAGKTVETDIAPSSLALLIGPEGGLSAGEIATAEKAGYNALRLGPRVMRTETAPLAAIAILQARWGDMGC